MDSPNRGDTPRWDEEAQSVLLRYRQKYNETENDVIQTRKGRKFRSCRLNDLVEQAFQMALPIVVALLTPKVHPILGKVSGFLSWRRQPMPTPSLSHLFFSGFGAKLIIDTVCFWDLAVLCWLQPRPARCELPQPMGVAHLELCALGTAAGLFVGRAAVLTSTYIRRVCFMISKRFQQNCVAWGHLTVPMVASFTGRLAAIFPLLGTSIVAPIIANYLERLFVESQLRRCSMSRQVICWFITWWGKVRAGPSLEWVIPDEVEIPHDLLCPITRQLFVQPVALLGCIFEEAPLRIWLDKTGRHPLFTDQCATTEDILPAEEMVDLCAAFARAHELHMAPV